MANEKHNYLWKRLEAKWSQFVIVCDMHLPLSMNLAIMRECLPSWFPAELYCAHQVWHWYIWCVVRLHTMTYTTLNLVWRLLGKHGQSAHMLTTPALVFILFFFFYRPSMWWPTCTVASLFLSGCIFGLRQGLTDRLVIDVIVDKCKWHGACSLSTIRLKLLVSVYHHVWAQTKCYT